MHLQWTRVIGEYLDRAPFVSFSALVPKTIYAMCILMRDDMPELVALGVSPQKFVLADFECFSTNGLCPMLF